MLKQRIITALLLAPILLTIVIYGDPRWFALLVGIIQSAATFEWLKINQLKSGLAAINALVITALTFYLFNSTAIDEQHWQWIFLTIWLLAVVWMMNYQWGSKNTSLQLFVKGILGVLAIMTFAFSIQQLYAIPDGNMWTLSLFLLIWVADIGAYISGKTMGKNKLAKNISPGKTWEGVIGAQLLVTVYAVVISQLFDISWAKALMVMIPIALFSVIGDLVASLGKRQAKIKDSSNLLPGHGGFIDRFDSLIAAAPLYFLLLTKL